MPARRSRATLQQRPQAGYLSSSALFTYRMSYYLCRASSSSTFPHVDTVRNKLAPPAIPAHACASD